MNEKNSESNEVIEISDDSCEAIFDSGAGTSGSGNLNMKRPPYFDEDDDDSDESDDVQFIEEESESEPDYECEVWDDDCIILATKLTSKLIEGIHHVKYISIPKPIDAKRQKLSLELNNQLSRDQTFFQIIKDSFLNANAFEEKNCELITDPWKVLVVNNLVEDVAILDEIRQEFNELDWNIRTMDLYEFNQSMDLENIHQENICLMYEFLKGDLMRWVADLTGLELVEVSATCSYYSDTDFLLVHDDQRGTRAVAFVLYLTGKEGWSVDWGGCLQLLNSDENKQPLKVTRNIIPRNNQLVMFPVSDRSYHQVEEVQCKNFCRLSINGWFHTKEPLTFSPPVYIPPEDGLIGSKFMHPVEEDYNLFEYIDDGYLVDETVTSIQSYIEENSEMSLETFFNEQKFVEVFEDLLSTDIQWKTMGPPNRRNYEYISENSLGLPKNLHTFIRFLKSKQFFTCLANYTGLELTRMKWEMQKWAKGSYSLITQNNVDRLDIMFCLGDTELVGGKTHYVTLEDEVQSALITTGCEVNFLNLVYGDTARYTALISKYSKSKGFYMFVASYFEDDEAKKPENHTVHVSLTSGTKSDNCTSSDKKSDNCTSSDNKSESEEIVALDKIPSDENITSDQKSENNGTSEPKPVHNTLDANPDINTASDIKSENHTTETTPSHDKPPPAVEAPEGLAS